jgi:hypothetical protein
MIKGKLKNIISGYRINEDDAAWLLALDGTAATQEIERLRAEVKALKRDIEIRRLQAQISSGITLEAVLDRAEQAEAELKTTKQQFRNFHRSLCQRFGYVHDEAFWWRDLCSLEEFISVKRDVASLNGIREGMK